MKSKIQNPKSNVIWILSFVILLSGCEAFVRKFTRKPKKENLPRVEMVIVPEEYETPQMSKEELYRQYFLYWKSWQDELINSLAYNTNHKKRIDCINEAIENLEQLGTALNSQMQEKLDIYISQLKELQESIIKDIYGKDVVNDRLTAERIKRKILRDFSYDKISKDISYGTQ